MAAVVETNQAPEYEHVGKCRHFERGSGQFLRIAMNPVVTICSSVLLWLFVILCCAMPDHMLKSMDVVAFDWIPEVWTWLYIISQDIWIFVLIYVMVISKYGNLKLGKEDDQPEFSLATWFSMLFSAGVAIGLFYYSVAEPMWHYKGWGGARFVSGVKGYGNSNEDATHALMVSFYHWGVHGWIPYTTLGAVLAIMTYRRGFPMTIRYCFWPLIGERCYGIIGDLIDILSIVTTIFGVCTSLGLGTMQINTGLQRLNHGFYRGVNYNIPDEAKYSTPNCGGTGQTCADGKEGYGIQVNVGTQVIIICIITLIATTSVVLGLRRGIVNLSRVNFGLGMFLMLCILFLGETWFCLDSTVQALGYYLFYFFKIAFHTDAFERLGSKDMGLGGAPDDLGGSAGWLSGWTIFYWGWWISWGPFVGTFIAKISKGRTLRQFILGTLIVPSLYSFMWFGVFGSEGIRMQRMADASGLCSATYAGKTELCVGADDGQTSSKCTAYAAQYSGAYKEDKSMGWTPNCVLDPDYHGGYGKCKEFEWKRFVVVGDQCVESTSWVDEPCQGQADPTALASPPTAGPCKDKITSDKVNKDSSSKMFNHFAGDLPKCFVPVQDGVVCLYNQGTTDVFFDQLASYGPRGFTDLLAVIGLVALLLYFVTSSDSGSFVVDMIAANGISDPPIVQKIFWAFTEGGTACALLLAGQNLPNADGSLKALQSCSMITGLPYTFVLFWCAQSLYLLVKEETGELKIDRPSFSTFILSFSEPLKLLRNTAVPGFAMGKLVKANGKWPMHSFGEEVCGIIWTAVFQLIYMSAILFVILTAVLKQWFMVGVALYFGFGSLLGFLRSSVRLQKGIEHGDVITDLVCGTFLPMFTITQMEVQDAIAIEVPKAAESQAAVEQTNV
jgi:choline-glycine betaine transporter